MEKIQQHKIRQLVRQASKGDKEAFSSLYSETVQAQYFTALSILKDGLLAEDVIQLTYLQVLQNLSKLSSPANFLAWLSRITYNNCMDALKKKKRLTMELTADIPTDIEDQSQETDPLHNALLSENHILLMETLDEISVEHRTVIILRYFQHLPVREIAKIMDTSEGTVRSRMHYALLKLKKKLNEKGFPGTDSLMGVGVALSRAYKRPAVSRFAKADSGKAFLPAFLFLGTLLIGGAAAAGSPVAVASADYRPPVVESVEKKPGSLIVTLSDDKSGINYDALKASQNGSPVNLKIISRKKGQIRLERGKKADIILTVSDNASNGKQYVLSSGESYSVDFE